MAEEDIVFGKNRHFFGGIEPSNMKTFNVTGDSISGLVYVSATLPSDTVINGQTLCTVAGAVIRRRIDNYPVDEFDGELVADISASATIVDTEASANDSYFYAAFPYTTQGVYNRSKANRVAYNEPQGMVKFSASSAFIFSTNTPQVEIVAELPEGCVGAIIRKSTATYPIDENDGEEFMTVTENGTYYDTDVYIGNTYYYSAFPYTGNGAFNRSGNNYASCIAERYSYFYGYDIDLADSNPDTRVSYPEEVDNRKYRPMSMNFSSGLFDYGNWPSNAGEKFMPRPCMLNPDGTVLHYLDQNNYALTVDGEPSGIDGSDTEANAMMQWPKIYTKRWEENGIYHFRCANLKIDDSYECWCNYDKDDNEIDYFYTAIYGGNPVGALISSQLRSITTNRSNTTSKADDLIAGAKLNGDDWYIETFGDFLLINDLLTMVTRTTNFKNAIGIGDNNLSSGAMDTKGLFWGSSADDNGVKVFGMEYYWGPARVVAGFSMSIHSSGDVYVTYKTYLKITRGMKDGSTAADYNVDATGYIPGPNFSIRNTDEVSIGTRAYLSECSTTTFGRIPSKANGSSTTYECANIYASGGKYVTAFERNTSVTAGPLNISTSDGSSCFARLSCKPSAK